MKPYTLAYPTAEHARAADEITSFFSGQAGVDAVLLMGSCARGKGVPDSCLDILILLHPETFERAREPLEAAWLHYYQNQPVFARLRAAGAFSHVDLEFIDGTFDPARHDHGWTTGADAFELEVGNTLAYSAPLWESSSYYQDLRAQWLPYYSEDLRQERLEMVLRCCHNNLEHIPLYAGRELYFQCFKRFYHAFEEFLQALFIYHRAYPIAYDKWVREGIVEVLGLPDLYPRLAALFDICHFESDQIVRHAALLNNLIDEFL
jgi:hypothetical protein